MNIHHSFASNDASNVASKTDHIKLHGIKLPRMCELTANDDNDIETAGQAVAHVSSSLADSKIVLGSV